MRNNNKLIVALSLGFLAATTASSLVLASVKNGAEANRVLSHGASPNPTPPPVPWPQRGVQKYAGLFGLRNLEHEEFDPPDYEVRVWRGFSNFSPLGFVISRRGSVSSATYFAKKLVSSNSLSTESRVYDKQGSGHQLEVEGLLVRLLTDEFLPDAGWGDPDAVSVAVEAKKGSEYRIIKYQVDTTIPSGRKLLRYVGELEKIYGVRLVKP